MLLKPQRDTSGVAGANKPTSGWTGKTVVALAGEDAQIPGLGPGAIAIEASSSGAPGCLALEPSTSRRKPDPLLGSPGGCSGRSGIRPSICSLYAKFTKRSKVCFCNSSSFKGSWEGTTAGPKTMKWWVWQNEGGWPPSPSLFITTGGSGGTCLHCFVACVTCPWGSFKVFSIKLCLILRLQLQLQTPDNQNIPMHERTRVPNLHVPKLCSLQGWKATQLTLEDSSAQSSNWRAFARAGDSISWSRKRTLRRLRGKGKNCDFLLNLYTHVDIFTCVYSIYAYRMTFDYVCARRNEIDPKGPCHIYIYSILGRWNWFLIHVGMGRPSLRMDRFGATDPFFAILSNKFLRLEIVVHSHPCWFLMIFISPTGMGMNHY